MKPKLVVNSGGMFSGKSTELLRQGQRHLYKKQRVVYLRPESDNRYSDSEIVTHDGRSVPAVTVGDTFLFSESFIDEYDVFLFDEVQFYLHHTMRAIQRILDSGKVVYCSGLDMDYRGIPFENTAMLMAQADEVNKLRAVCSGCGADATFSYRNKSLGTETVLLGSEEAYKPLCRSCYQQEGRKQ
ncbi:MULTISPECIES: thymidine kinase [unclassified Exiguobacterium]|uniref:thymidine kinase n=1 Tax=unclassified Exiguobacterium TaxID=2644629 RepID=UPI001BEBFDCD|nr:MULTISPECIES: thymidine kinase [unclassified Exiguobacterium]